MKQAALQLKMRVQNVNIMNNNIGVEGIVLKSMLFILAGLALWYALILGNMIFDIVQRKVFEKEAMVLANEVGNLELSYLSISKTVDLNLSRSMGFKEVKASFATRKSLGLNTENLDSLSSVRNEI
jgi:hypothetical protein